MIVSHKYKFVICVPVGLNAGDWLTRIAEEGDPGHLEVVGMPNGVVVPENCGKYKRYFVDAPHHRISQLWTGRVGTPWEGPVQVQDPNDPSEWLKWYMFSMRKKYLEIGVHSSPNGWGMRGEDGDWCYFEHPKTLIRTFAGIGNSPLGEDAPWGRKQPVLLKMEEYSRGWRDLIREVKSKGGGGKTTPPEVRNTMDLLRWHMPSMQCLYEIGDELVNALWKESAWEYTKQPGATDDA